jgi:hypothetical protein
MVTKTPTRLCAFSSPNIRHPSPPYSADWA